MTPEDDDLDADLRALFAEARLSVPVGENAVAAVASVVAGARRRRRRRGTLLATCGALGVTAVLLAGGLLVGHMLPPNRTEVGNPPGLATSSYSTATPQKTGPRPAPEVVNLPPNAPTVLGPTGYGAIQLGMTAEQVLATQLVNTPTSQTAGCAGYTYVPPTRGRSSAAAASAAAPAEGQRTSLYVYLSARAPAGVRLIVVPSGVITPEGIGVGSPVAMLRATYRDLPAQTNSGQLVPVPGHPGLSYRFTIDNGTVSSVGLGLTGEMC